MTESISIFLEEPTTHAKRYGTAVELQYKRNEQNVVETDQTVIQECIAATQGYKA